MKETDALVTMLKPLHSRFLYQNIDYYRSKNIIIFFHRGMLKFGLELARNQRKHSLFPAEDISKDISIKLKSS